MQDFSVVAFLRQSKDLFTIGGKNMKNGWLLLGASGFIAVGVLFSLPDMALTEASEALEQNSSEIQTHQGSQRLARLFEVQVLVNGVPLDGYPARGRTYVEAIRGAEYELRIRNPLPVRVAVALSVDGLNSIDARRTSSWEASKWVIGPYQTIHISGWQMSSDRARRFYFTNERDSYAAKLGQTGNLGVIAAVFYRERPRAVVPVTPPPYKRVPSEKERASDQRERLPSTQTHKPEARGPVSPAPEDYASTGIGRSVRHDVRWVSMELEPRPAGAVTIRYEYHEALVRLGIRPKRYVEPDPLRRRESSRGFEDRRFSPEP